MRIIVSALIVVTAILSQSTMASPRADSILALTGGLQVKAAWFRAQWCDENYNRILNDPEQYQSNSRIIVFDTKEGVERIIDSTIGFHGGPHINRKDGTYIMWPDVPSKCTWIRDYAGKTPKRKLLTGKYWLLECVQYNPATGEEFVYATDYNTRMEVVRMPFTSAGTADTAHTVKLKNPNNQSYDALNVSADGKYMGTALPWPNTFIVDIANATLISRHCPSDQFGCNANIAPDNSYRFWHFNDNHNTFRLFDANLVNNYTSVPINLNLPGNTLPAAGMDCGNTRWATKVPFFSLNYPGPDGAGWNPAALSAVQIKAENPSRVSHCCLGKFSADYKRVEKYVLLADMDIRREDMEPYVFIGDTQVSLHKPVLAAFRSTAPTFSLHGSIVEATFQSTGLMSVMSLGGRVIAKTLGNGRTVCDLSNVPAGSYIVKVQTGFATNVEPILLSR